MLLASLAIIVITSSVQAHEPVTEEQIAEAAADPEWIYRKNFLADIQSRNLNRLDEKENFLRRLAEGKAAGLSNREIGRRIFGGPDPAFPTGTGPIGSIGDRRILTILIDFPDENADLSVDLVRQGIVGDGGPNADDFFPFDSVRNYYRRASQGKLELGGDVEGWVRMDGDREEYKPVYHVSDSPSERLVKDQKALLDIFREAMAKIDDVVDFGEYDNDNDGDIDGIVFVYAGEPEGWGDFFWAYRWTFFIPEALQADAKFDGKRIEQFVFQFVEERENGDYENRTLVHEVGHLLGLNDYYDYCTSQHFQMDLCPASVDDPGPDGGVGKLDMMDGNWGNHNAYSRWLMDWIAPEIVGTGTHEFEIRASGEDGPADNGLVDAVAIFPNLDTTFDANAPGKEMFIVEYRNGVGNDTLIPGDGGVVIWHLAADNNDAPLDTEFDNSYTTPKQLRFVRSHTKDDFGPNGRVRIEDFYVDGMTFGPTSTPASISHNGIHTGVTVSNIEINEATARLTIDVSPVEFLVSGLEPPEPIDTPTAAPPAGIAPPSPAAAEDPFDIQRLAVMERTLTDLSSDQLAERWRALESTFVAGNASPIDETEARLTLIKWAQKDGIRALSAIEGSPSSVQDATSDIVDDVLRAFVEASPLQAGNEYLNPNSDLVRMYVEESGELGFVRDVFAARAFSNQEILADGIAQIEGTEQLFSAVRGLRKGGTSLEDLSNLEPLLGTNQIGLRNAIELEQSIDRISRTRTGAAAPDLADQLLRAMQQDMELQRAIK